MPIEPVRVWNPPNPYLTEHRELIGEPPPAGTVEVYEDQSQEILSHNDSPDLGFRWSVNPYRGCWHACLYCLMGDTEIAMANGRTKRLSDIQIGDETYGVTFRGRYHRIVKTQVLARWLTFKPAYRITLKDGTQLTASADHRFLTTRGWKYVTGEEQGRNCRPHLTLNNKLLGTGKAPAPPNENIEYQKGYLCGMIRGDGLLRSYGYDGRTSTAIHQFRLALVDPEGLQRTSRYLSAFDIPTFEYLFQAAKPGYKPLQAIRNGFRFDVDHIGELVRWPLAPDLNWRKGFLAGIFDAEGSYSCWILRISNTNPEIIKHITESLGEFNFDYVVENRLLYKSEKPIYFVRVRGGLVEHRRFFQIVNPAITRKIDVVGQAIKNRSKLQVTSIKDLGISLPMYDITTGTGNFIANGVVSHNCYARPTHEYFGLGAGTDFERKIFIKKNAAGLLERAFRRRSWQGERIVFSGVTDCYQPLEAAWKLTRGCLETCLKFRNPAGIITKSALIRRDADVLQGLTREASVHVSISIPFFDEEIARKVEPGAPMIRKRFETMEILAKAGVEVGIGVAPIIPGLNDRDIPALLKEAKRRGARWAFRTLLRLPGSVRQAFLHRIRQDLPLKAHRIEERVKDSRGGAWYDSRFGHRHSGQGNYWEAIEQQWEIWTERLGFNKVEEGQEKTSTFRRPNPNGQIEFDLY
jgi:DNA repair photolyase